jgi:hypothetical protein
MVRNPPAQQTPRKTAGRATESRSSRRARRDGPHCAIAPPLLKTALVTQNRLPNPVHGQAVVIFRSILPYGRHSRLP